MEQAEQLVRMVARAFYEPEHIVVMDALVFHSACNVEDLRRIFVATGRNKQDLQKMTGRLREGGLISMFARLETKPGAQKPTNVEYYYVDYRRAIDAVKYRLHLLEEKLRREAAPTEEKKEYQCSQCKSEWTQMEVIDNADPLRRRSGFLCHRCQFPLDFYANDPDAAENDGPLGMFNNQFGWLVSLLRDIDNATIPEVSGEEAVANAVPVPVEKEQLPGQKAEAVPVKVQPASVKGINTGPEKVDVSISANSEITAAQYAAAAEQKARLANQNQLPEWHTKSTVTNEMTAVGQREEAARREREMEASILHGDAGEDKKTAAQSSLDDIFAQLENAARVENAAQDEDDEEEEEEDDEEFEDVISDTGPESKKVKLDENGTGNDSSVTGTPVAAGIEEDSEDEFEDV